MPYRPLVGVIAGLALLLFGYSAILRAGSYGTLGVSPRSAADSAAYLPFVMKQVPTAPTPTVTITPAVTFTATISPTPTTPPVATATSIPGGYTYYLTGDPANAQTSTEAGLMLMGGGEDVDAAFTWLIDKSGGGDVVVLRASGSDGYNHYIYHELGGVDSVETLVIRQRFAAYDPFVLSKVQNAEALFIAGGDQWDYVSRWKGTPLEAAIHDLASQEVPIGGTSAGLAILGEFFFSAQNGTVYSDEALADPYNHYMTLDREFLMLPHLDGVITDSHFFERDRMGRLIAFLARISQDGWASDVKGIGINEETAVLIEADGNATLVGSGAAYFLRTTAPPQLCQPNTPLTLLDVQLYRLFAGASFNLATWTGSGGTAYQISATGGVLSSTQPGGGLY